MRTKMCLTCLEKPTAKMRDIDDDEMWKKIEECGDFDIKLIKHKDSPNKICNVCYAKLNIAHEFRLVCQRTQEELRRRLSSEFQMTLLEVETLVDFKTEFDEASDGETPMLVEELTDGDYLDETKLEDDVYVHDGADWSYLPDEECINADVPENSEPQATATENDVNSINFKIISNDDIPNPLKPDGRKVRAKRKPTITATKKRQKAKVEMLNGNFKVVSRIDQNTGKCVEYKRPTKYIVTRAPEFFMCHECGNKFPDKGRLNAHMNQHKLPEEKSYQCEICKKFFNTARQVQIHMNTHTGQRPYKCKFCSNAFKDPSSVIRHERVHENIRPYSCDECGKSFTYSHALKKHKFIHTGEKPFSCDFCDKRFTLAHHKKQHEQTHRNTKTINIEN